MTEARVADALRDARDAGSPVELRGRGTLLARMPPSGGGEPSVLSLAEHAGIVSHEPEDLTVTVRAGTPVRVLDAALAERGQECPVEGPGSTVGGRIASGLTGIRRLGVGHVREWVLGGRLLTARGEAMRFGGPTVKNVTGYDLPRLLCGSWGTLAVLTEVTLRVRPLPAFSGWFTTDDPEVGPTSLYRPTAVVADREGRHVLLEGHPEDCREQARRAGLVPSSEPSLPDGVRLAVPPERVDELVSRIDGDCAAELGVGVVHARPAPGSLPSLRSHAEALGGRALVLEPDAEIGAFGDPGEASALDLRLKRTLDPDGLFASRGFPA